MRIARHGKLVQYEQKFMIVEEDTIMNAYLERVLAETKAKNANEPEFLQTVEEVLSSLEPVINAHPE